MCEAKMEVLFLEGARVGGALDFFAEKSFGFRRISLDPALGCVFFLLWPPGAGFYTVFIRKLGCHCSFYLDGCELRASVPMRGFLLLTLLLMLIKSLYQATVRNFSFVSCVLIKI